MEPKEYLDQVIKLINETENSLSEDDRMPVELLNLWVSKISEFCSLSYQEYLIGNRETYYMSEQEYDKIFDEAGREYAGNLLNSLVDRELVEVGVSDQGEIVYKATDLAYKLVGKERK